MADYSVTYWVIRAKRKKEKVTNICFSNLNYDTSAITRIQYLANVDHQFWGKREIVDFYLELVRYFLDPTLWTMKYLEDGKKIFYVLNCTGMNPHVRLLYLTALRYIDEYPEVVLTLHDRHKDERDMDKLFAYFQTIQKEDAYGGLAYPAKYGLRGGHSLIDPYYFKKPVTVKQLRENIKTKPSVNSMFKS